MRISRRLAVALLVLSLGLAPEVLRPLVARAALPVATNVNISKLPGNQSEGAIAINPTNPKNIVVTSNIDTGEGLFKAFSTNGGATWTSTLIANGTDSLPHACCDSSLAFDNYGNLFLTYLDVSSVPYKVQVALSTNGGQTFTFLATVATGGVDQPTITAAAGSVWVTYQADDGNVAAAGAPVTGLGTVGSFITPEEVANSYGNFGDIAIGPSGQVMVTWETETNCTNLGCAGPQDLEVSVDADGLGPGGFGSPVTVTGTKVGGFDPIPAQAERTIDAEAGLAWDRSGGTHNGRIYFVYTDTLGPYDASTTLYVRHSDDSGATWSAPVQVNDGPAGHSHFLPRIALDQTTGNIAVSWYDTRNDPNNVNAQFFATESTDGGATFQPNVQVSAGSSNASAIGGIQFGDYTGLAFQSGAFYPLWSDNSNSTGDNPGGTGNTLDLYTARVPSHVVPNLTITSSSGTTYAYSLTVTPAQNTPCAGTFTGTGVVAGSPAVNQTITGSYYGSTVYFLAGYQNSLAYLYGTLLDRPGAPGNATGTGKDSGGFTRTYVATGNALFQAGQVGCQDLNVSAPTGLAGSTVKTTTTRSVGTVTDPDGFSGFSPDLAITVRFGDGGMASCTGSACFTGTTLPEHIRLVNCSRATVPALPGLATFPGAPLDTSCDVQMTHVYTSASSVNGYQVTLTVTDKDQTNQPAPATTSIVATS